MVGEPALTQPITPINHLHAIVTFNIVLKKKLLIVKLPNGRIADLGNKIEAYSLNLNHQEGKNKAILFASKLGITIENAELLKQALKKAAINEDVVIQKTNRHLQKSQF